jgi:hypothetical protein
MDWMPLGDYETFRGWSGQPRSWGPEDARWRVWFGGNVVDGLCGVLDEHLAAQRRGVPAAIGCVPWLTSAAVVDRLLNLTACCVVLNKGARFPPPPRLVNSANGLPNTAIPNLELMTPAVDGNAPVLGPYGPMPEHDIGPVRLLGHDREDRKPLLHAKLLVLGEIAEIAYGPGEGPFVWESHFVPQAVWWGSANWTALSRSHLEVGFFCNDPALTRDAADFVADVIAFSEPVDTTCVGPEPNLVHVEFDDAAMAEAWEQHLAYLESQAEDVGQDDW